MKKLVIEVRVIDNKVANLIQTTGFSNEVISDQFELLGILDNLKGIIQERIRKLVDISKDGNN